MLDETEREQAAQDHTGELAKLLRMPQRPETAIKITEPGLYDDLDHFTYHADPVPGRSLSNSGARMILSRCPAYFKWWRDQPPGQPLAVPPTPSQNRYLDFGQAAHTKLLGVGPELVEIKCPDYYSKIAKEQWYEARERGAVPLLTKEMQQVDDMIDAIRAHPQAGRIFDPDHGQGEQSFFWEDASTKIMRRCRVDWLPEATGGRMILVDYKTTKSAHPAQFARDVINLDYDMAAQWYCEGVTAVLGVETAMIIVAQEKTPPYLVSVMQFTDEHYWRGERRARRAVDTYAECMATDHWPSYNDDQQPAILHYPVWAPE